MVSRLGFKMDTEVAMESTSVPAESGLFEIAFLPAFTLLLGERLQM